MKLFCTIVVEITYTLSMTSAPGNLAPKLIVFGRGGFPPQTPPSAARVQIPRHPRSRGDLYPPVCLCHLLCSPRFRISLAEPQIITFIWRRADPGDTPHFGFINRRIVPPKRRDGWRAQFCRYCDLQFFGNNY